MQLTQAQQTRVESERRKAAARYPDEWAKTLTMEGFRRRRRQKALRDMAVEAEGCARARMKGGSCANCMHLLTNVVGLQGTFCDLDSDYRGYQHVSPDSVCSRWKPARPDV